MLVKRIIICLSVAISTYIGAAEFKEYKGSVFEKKATEMAMTFSKMVGDKGGSKVYSSNDSYEKVRDFYLAIGKETMKDMPKMKLEDGTTIKKSIIILDGASDIETSKSWVSIQEPYIGNIEPQKGGKLKYIDIRKGVTAIQWAFN